MSIATGSGRTDPVGQAWTWLVTGIPLSLLVDLARPNGPGSAEILATERFHQDVATNAGYGIRPTAEDTRLRGSA